MQYHIYVSLFHEKTSVECWMIEVKPCSISNSCFFSHFFSSFRVNLLEIHPFSQPSKNKTFPLSHEKFNCRLLLSISKFSTSQDIHRDVFYSLRKEKGEIPGIQYPFKIVLINHKKLQHNPIKLLHNFDQSDFSNSHLLLLPSFLLCRYGGGLWNRGFHLLTSFYE